MSDIYEGTGKENPLELFEWYYKDSDEKWVHVTLHDLERYFTEGKISRETMVAWNGLAGEGFSFGDIEAEFFYEFAGKVQSVYTEAELHNAFSENKINLSTTIWGKLLPSQGLPYSSYKFADVVFEPDIKQFIEMRRGHLTTVLSGSNNSGKTLALKFLRRELGPSINYLACNRFYNIDYLNPATEQKGQYGQRHTSFITQLYQQPHNFEQNDFPLQQVVSQLKDEQRNTLFFLCTEMLGEEFDLAQVDSQNKLSQYFISVGGQKLAISSTGTRLLMMLVAACMDDHYNTVLIDEPEIGLSPSLQTSLARYLFSSEKRQSYFPHLKQLIIATHSHLLLDKSDITNNFIFSRNMNRITIRQVDSICTYHNLQFNMLGNTLESPFLPSVIVIVEGDTDHDYIKKIFQIYFPDKRVSVVKSDGDGGTKNQLYVIKSTLGDLQMSPYRERIFILLDENHSVRVRDFTKHGVPSKNVVIFDENGIEMYYPQQILAEIFACNPQEVLSLLTVEDNKVRVRDIAMTKKELCQKVLERLTSESEIPSEIREKLLSPIAEILGS